MSKTQKLVPTLTVDNVIFGYAHGELFLLLVKHGIGKSKGSWGLPGDWLRSDESLEEAAARILYTRTSLDHIELQQMHTFSAVDRYPGKRIVTTAFYTLIKKDIQPISPSEDELEAAWFPIADVPKLIFDHTEIVNTGLAKLQNQARHEPIGLSLLPKKFTFLQLQELYEAVLQQRFDKPNFRRKMRSHKFLVDCNEQVKAGSHRSAALYRFDVRAYKALIKQGFSFTL